VACEIEITVISFEPKIATQIWRKRFARNARAPSVLEDSSGGGFPSTALSKERSWKGFGFENHLFSVPLRKKTNN